MKRYYAFPGARSFGGRPVAFPPEVSRLVEATGATTREGEVLLREVKPVDCPAHREWIRANDLECV